MFNVQHKLEDYVHDVITKLCELGPDDLGTFAVWHWCAQDAALRALVQGLDVHLEEYRRCVMGTKWHDDDWRSLYVEAQKRNTEVILERMREANKAGIGTRVEPLTTEERNVIIRTLIDESEEI